MKLLEHLHASRRLPDLLDDALTTREATRLRAHVARCGRCAGKLDRLERSEALLARLPRMLFPLEATSAGGPETRLATLAQWSARPSRQPYGALPAAGAAAAAALIFALSVTAPEWGSVMVGDMGASTTVASVMPDSSFYPMTLR